VTATLVVPVVDEGLGNSSYLVDLGDGRALAVDAPRDLRAVRAAAGRHGLRIAFAADTHLHADFLSGAVQLAADDGAQILASAAGLRAFDHRGLADGDEVDLGGLILRAWATPGHTAEHLAYLLLDGGRVLGVFTGGSLLVRAAVAGPDQDLDEVSWQALMIGYQNLAGTLAGGLPAWQGAGHPVAAIPLLAPGQVDPAAVIDVRQAAEYAAGHLRGARHIELGALAGQAASLAGRPVVTMCGHGERAATAASVLERAGHAEVAVLTGGPADWSETTGMALETSA
jgi:glyoxylase-like metal-dependent hydrolase (beta-lactamase superfamily II)